MEEEDSEVMDYSIKQDDYDIVKKVLGLQGINFYKLFNAMSLDKLSKVVEKMVMEKNGNRIAETLSKLIPEVNKLEDTQNNFT